ncbi:oxidoreductase [Sphingomonas metalli]|uniref:Oxidoreductase n=1 Tax=Sphingomonas metalli TaxID=1779358 RepID=A0A916SYU2_9SPHN|nr:LLM class flavin-dependent oxidoreductase [Sphingomonas metalli]GGB20523.1 oxidoreductase [Sphingomonas metalli]
MTLQLGLDTFGDVTEQDGVAVHPAQAIRDVVEQGVAAEQAGLDFFGVGEHHRADFAVSSPEMVLAAIAARTQRIRLGSAVTVLSSDDPVRVFQRFATLDAVSSGRAEVILGRGSFTESFPLFGYPLDQYERLFDEKLDLFATLRGTEGPVTWRGSVRPSLTEQSVFPPVEHAPLTTWIGVGGSPQSVVRAAHYGLPMLLAIIGGDPARFRPYVDLYARALAEGQRPLLPVGVHSPGYVGRDDATAREEFFPDYKRMHDRIGSTRGWPPLSRAQFDAEVEGGSLYVGGPETVAQKIARTVRTLDLSRFQLKYSAGPLSHARLMGCIERYGREVAPRVRALLEEKDA